MNRAERIKKILSEALSPSHLELQDESVKHRGHSGARPEGETHFHLKISTPGFASLTKVQRHQKIYALLAEEFKTGLHALSIEANA